MNHISVFLHHTMSLLCHPLMFIAWRSIHCYSSEGSAHVKASWSKIPKWCRSYSLGVRHPVDCSCSARGTFTLCHHVCRGWRGVPKDEWCGKVGNKAMLRGVSVCPLLLEHVGRFWSDSELLNGPIASWGDGVCLKQVQTSVAQSTHSVH